MKLRKYAKVFQNERNARRLYEREADRWERSTLGNEFMPNKDMMFDDSSRTRRRFTVTYYRPVYAKTQAVSEGDLYGKNKSDAITKFRKLFADNFPTQRLVIKSASLKAVHGGGMKLYAFKYYTKAKK